jgi:hypothetical protein
MFRLRRCFQFSIRTMLLVTTVAAVLVWVLLQPWWDYEANRTFKEQLRALGGRVQEEPIGEGMITRFYPKLALRVVRIDLVNRRLTDEDMIGVGELCDLRDLYLYGTDVGDATCRRLRRCRQLETVDLDGTQVTDEGVAAISNLPKLQWLYLRNTAVTDAALRHLESTESLQKVVVWQTGVSTQGVVSLRAARPDTLVYDSPLRRSAQSTQSPLGAE